MCWAHVIVVRVISQDCFILDLTTPSLAIESPSCVFCVPLEDLIIIVFAPFLMEFIMGRAVFSKPSMLKFQTSMPQNVSLIEERLLQM